MFPPVFLVVFPCFHQLQLQEGSSVTRLSQYSRGASWLSGHLNRYISFSVVSSCIEHDGKPSGGGGSFALHSFTELTSRWCVTGVGPAQQTVSADKQESKHMAASLRVRWLKRRLEDLPLETRPSTM